MNRQAGFRFCACTVPFFLLSVLCRAQAVPAGPEFVTLDSPLPLVQIVVMVKAGSTDDPPGREGLASLTARILLEGGYGQASNPVTKEQLALLVRPWGSGAAPSVRVAKEVTTFYFSVPEDVLDEYLEKVLGALFSQPLFETQELDRLRKEALEQIRGRLRYEDIESLGLNAIDHFVNQGTRYAHLSNGSVEGLLAIQRTDVEAFYKDYYRTNNLIIGISKTGEAFHQKVAAALSRMGDGASGGAPRERPTEKPAELKGRHLVIVSLPNAESTGLHAAFPIPLTRRDEDFWPLYIANVYFGTHRDGFSHLYREIRQERGYNYGDYSYIEHFEGRPFALFPPFNTPRHSQYFSIWIRPVAHVYAHHLLKAFTWELDNFVRSGLTNEQVEAAKNKARVLYLNLAETVSRLLQARVDDAYYGMVGEGYLEHYLKRIDAVTTEQVNAAIRRYLQADNLSYVVVTDDEAAGPLAEAIAADGYVEGKSLEEYRVTTIEQEGGEVYAIAPSMLGMLKKDAVWAAYPLDIPRENIRIVPVEQLFQSADFVAEK